jgi:transposase
MRLKPTGASAQVDWKEFGKQVVDGIEKKLYAFVMVLGYSRKALYDSPRAWISYPACLPQPCV